MIYSFVDERKVLDILLKNKKTININPNQKIMVYIKYLKEKKKTKKEIRNIIDELMIDYYNGFVMADWDKRLGSLVNKYTKKEYREFKKVSDINITEKELEYIKSFQNIELEKLLFVMLVIAKANPNDSCEKGYWVNCDSKELFSLSKFKYKSRVDRFKQREYFLYDIKEKGLIEVKKIVDSTGIKLLYCDPNYDVNGLMLKINEQNIDSLVLYYLRWRGDYKIIECSSCGKLAEQNSKKPQIYCKDCAKKINILKTNRKY